MNCIGCHKKIKKGEFVTLNGGAMVKTKSGAEMGGKDLSGFLVINNHFDSKKDYRSMSLAQNGPNGQFELYACSHRCLEHYLTRQITVLKLFSKIRKIVSVSNEKIKNLQPFVKMVLNVLGHPEALVTDMSTIWDFVEIDEEEKIPKKWSEKLGINVKGSDYIWKIADKLRVQSLKKVGPINWNTPLHRYPGSKKLNILAC
jgi:hypothetical protein